MNLPKPGAGTRFIEKVAPFASVLAGGRRRDRAPWSRQDLVQDHHAGAHSSWAEGLIHDTSTRFRAGIRCLG
jgi:hypothetical protein